MYVRAHVCVCTPAGIQVYGERESGESTSKLTDASFTLGEEKSKSKYCVSPACTPILFGGMKEGKTPKQQTTGWTGIL